MDVKFAQVNGWLAQCFPDGIPGYEITDKTIELLSKLRETSEMHEELCNLIKGDLVKKTNEYNAEAERLELTLKEAGLASDSLSPQTRTLLNLISHLYNDLGLRSDRSISSAKIAVYNLHRELLETNSELEIANLLLDDMNKSHEALKLRRQQLKKLRNEIQTKTGNGLGSEHDIQSLMNDNLLENEEYQNKIKRIEETLAERKYSPSISCEALNKKFKEIESLQTELSTLNKDLEKYHGLPADFDSAQQTIENVEHELELLDQQLTEEMNTYVKLAKET